MTYIGQQPATTFDAGIQDRFTGLTTNTVTLNHEISAEEDILVVWNNIVQDKNTYSVGGTGNKTVTLGGTLVSADVVTVYYLNKVMQSVNPTANSVGITELNVSDGSNGHALTTNGSGTLSFASAGAALTGSTDNTVVTVTGANAMQGETNFIYNGTIVGVGADGSNADLGSGIHIKKADSGASALADADELVIESDADVGISILQHTGGNGTIAFGDSGDNNIGMLQYYHGSVNCFAITASASESVRIKDDRVGIGTGANVDDARLHIETPDQQCLKLQRPGTSNSGHCVIVNDNGTVGEISSNGSTTTYATSSDYRLKENVNYTFDATTRLKQLKPARFNWIADDTNTLLDGFLAHEVSSIVPEAVNKSKDATKTLTNVVLDANGKVLNNKISEDEWKEEKEKGTYPANSTWQSSKSVPDYQTIDESKLVPLLVKTIQELEARVKTLEDA